MEVAATLMAPKVAWELEGLATRMQEREEEGEVGAIGEWREAEEVARQEGKNIFFTHKEVLTSKSPKSILRSARRRVFHLSRSTRG